MQHFQCGLSFRETPNEDFGQINLRAIGVECANDGRCDPNKVAIKISRLRRYHPTERSSPNSTISKF
ncbi:hypothetical protein ACTXT7_005747 [Hymenolepis weldensis]